MGAIDWNQDAVSIERLIRGLNPWPSAYTTWDNKDVYKRQDLMEECGLLVKAEFFGQEDTHPEVLTYDSREVTENTMFICKGAAFKEEYLTSAVEKGAILYISEKEYDTGKDIPHILVKDIRKAMAVLADVFYGSAWKELTVTGIGGTKGKSTSAYYMKSVVDDYMKETGKPESAVISSIDIYDGVSRVESHITTPEAVEPVSYTHLDVYKRQVNCRTSDICMRRCSLLTSIPEPWRT